MKVKYILYCIVFYCISCSSNAGEIKNPPGYDLSKPEKFILPGVLTEISGIAMYNDSIFAEQDEEGKVFHFKLGDKEIVTTKFGKKGDYEDISICNAEVFVLKSNGSLFSFPLTVIQNKELENVQEWKDLLPAGEYEGMYADQANNNLYILCKHCDDDKVLKGYIFKLGTDSITPTGNFSVDIKSIAASTGEKKIKFHPSGLAKNPLTSEWYILSSVNKLLLVTDSNWTVKDTYPLPVSLFNQPEGITFDNQGNLYISNEGGDTSEGNIFKFTQKK